MNPTSTIPPLELLVVMPVFNEEESLAGVVDEWLPELARWVDDFAILAIDDGSTDATNHRLKQMCKQHGLKLEIRSRENRGHGASCVEGYRDAVERRIPWVFQIDSDGQCDPRFFGRLWQKREDFDVIYGARVWREDGLVRMAASCLLKFVLLVQERVYCVDPNSPYRLMRSSVLADRLDAVEPVYLANVALAVLLRRDPTVRHGSVPIHFRERSGGVASIKLKQFGRKALELMKQLRAMNR